MSSSAVLKEKVYTKQGITGHFTYKTLFKVIYYIMTVLMKKSSECFSQSVLSQYRVKRKETGIWPCMHLMLLFLL